MSRNALFINYEYCTGCHGCEVACQVEHDLPADQFGIKILEDGPRQLESGKWEWNYVPVPTSLCDLCADRVAAGRLPRCVHHCQAGIMNYGTVEEMSKYMDMYPNSAMFTPEV